MSKSNAVRRLFNKDEIQILSKNPNVLRVTEKKITYSPTFKLNCIKAYQSGEKPKKIFIDACFDINMIGYKNPSDLISRWNQTYQTFGENALCEDLRGRIRKGKKYPKKICKQSNENNFSLQEKLKQAESQIKFLEAENQFLRTFLLNKGV